MKQATVTEKRIAPRKSAAAKPVAATKQASAPRKAITAGRKATLAVAAGVIRKFHVFLEGARPAAGPRLAAHTNAVLLFLRMAEMIPAKREAVLALLGTRAVNYHRSIGNFVEKADCLALTSKGYNFFRGRVEEGKVSGELSAAFLAAIEKGKTNETAQIKAAHLESVSMATN